MKTKDSLFSILLLCFGLIAGRLLTDYKFAPVVAGSVIELRASIPISTLQQIVGSALTDEVAYQRVMANYDQNRDFLARLWNEPNELRLRALYAMAVVHISHPYGKVTRPSQTFVGYVRNETLSHCGIQPLWQGEISERLGLSVRLASIAGWHGWLEVKIDNHWESFDATTNTWLSVSAQELLAGKTHYYRALFTDQYETLKLRNELLAIGITWQPGGTLTIAELPTIL